MTPELLLSAALRLQRGGAGSAWEVCARLLSDLSPDRAIVCAALPGSYTTMRLRRAVPPDRLFRFAPCAAPEAGEETGEPGAPFLVLGDHDATWRRSAPLPWLAPAPARDAKIRRLDTLLGPNQAPGLLLIESPADAASILRGAAGILSGATAPAIVLDLTTALPDTRAGIWEACAEIIGDGAGYAWHDAVLAPCPSPQSRRDAVTLCGERIAVALPGGWPGLGADGGDVFARFLAASRARGWRPMVEADAAARRELAIAFDGELAATGFYPPETDGAGTFWRWSGPGAHAGFRLPCPGPGRWRLVLQVYNWGSVHAPEALRVFCAGEGLTLEESGGGHAAYAGITVPDADPPVSLAITLVTPPPHRPTPWDSRRLGINLTRCLLVPV